MHRIVELKKSDEERSATCPGGKALYYYIEEVMTGFLYLLVLKITATPAFSCIK